MPDYTITLTDLPDPADIEAVKQGLDTYDASQGAVVDWVPLALFARNSEGVIIAGLTGSTYWGYLYVGRSVDRSALPLRPGWAANCWNRPNRRRSGAAATPPT